MSLYNRLFGENENAIPLLGMLSLTRKSFGRYRDVYLNKEGTKITVISRIGGNNVAEYKDVYTNLRKHPNWITDYDDAFDSTYAYFEFTVPDKYAQTCKMIAPKEDRLSVGDMFKKETEEAGIPGSAASKRMEQIAMELFENLSGDEDGPEGIRFINL